MRTRFALPAVGCCLLMSALVGAKPPKEAGGPPAAATQPPLPEAVQKTVAEHFPTGTIEDYEHHVEDTRHLYFVDIKTGGETVTLLASGRGQYLGMVSEEPGDEETDVFIDVKTAPKGVKDGIGKYFSPEDVTKEPAIDSLYMEVEEARFMFVAEQTTNGVSKWVTFSIGGNVVSVEQEVAIKNLPRAVAAVMKWSITSASFVEDKEKKSTTYVLEVEKDGAKREVTVTPEGKVVSDDPAEEDTTRP